MQCPKCGRESRGLCIDCLLEERPITVKEPELERCTGCGLYWHKGNWTEIGKNELAEIVRKNLKVPHGIKIEELSIKPDEEKNYLKLDITLLGNYKNKKFEKKLETKVKIKKTQCKKCCRMSGSYYEAILQVRGFEFSDLDENFVAKAVKVAGGTDFYISSMNYARKLKNHLRDAGFFVNESEKLVGMKEGKNLYRVSISVKPPAFGEGDVLKYGNELLYVKKLGRVVGVVDLKTGEKKGIDMNKLKKPGIAAKKSELRNALVSAVSPKGMHIIDTENHEVYDVARIEDAQSGDTMNFVRISGKIYVIKK